MASKNTKKRYIQSNGPVTVCKGASRLIKVTKDHPAALAIELNEKMGGKSRVTGYGVRLADKDGFVYAVIKGVTKDKTAFGVYHSNYRSAKERYETLASNIRQDRKGSPLALVDDIDRDRVSEALLQKIHTLASEGAQAKVAARAEKRAAKQAKKAPKAKKTARKAIPAQAPVEPKPEEQQTAASA